MRRWFALSAALLASLAPAPAAADLFGRFQHGGRATGQAGAYVARAGDPAAVGYNPAAIVRLTGFELQAGLDFDAPTDDYSSATATASAKHSIQFPPALYAAWHPQGARWALGLGLDSPTWRLTFWDTALFPARFTARRSEATLFALHPVAAWAIDDRWSVGGGLRYVRGTLGYGDTRSASAAGAGGPDDLEVDRRAEASADGLGFDLAVHYATERWGWGATLLSAVEVQGSGDLEYQVRDLQSLPAGTQADLLERFRTGSSTLSEELPERLTGGAWFAPAPSLRLELDLAIARWSAAAARASYEPEVLGPGFALDRRDGWDDTLSIRLGAEWTLPDPRWRLGGGLALEPSPAPDGAVEPGAPLGDATVYALGASFDLDARLSFDLGYSYHDFGSRDAARQEPDPAVAARYQARAQVFAVSARWRFAAVR